MDANEEQAVAGLQRIIEVGDKSDYAALMQLVQRHSMQWLVDACYQWDPHIISISAPSLLASFPSAEEKPDPTIDDETWEGIKRSISQTVSDYLK